MIDAIACDGFDSAEMRIEDHVARMGYISPVAD